MRRLLAFVLTASACAAHPDPEADDPGDAEHDAFLGKNDGGSCLEPDGAIAEGVLALVNDPTVTADELDASTEDGGAGLNRSAAYNIVDARPIADLGALDAVPWVGPTSCAALAAYACNVADRCHQEVTAMTWNLETFPLTAQTEEAVVEVFQQIQPDVVGLQEIEDTVAFERMMDRLPDYDAFLAEPGTYNGVAVVVRRDALQLLSTEDLFVDDWYAFPRPVIAARLQVPGGAAFELAVVHLKASGGESNESRRRTATTRLLQWIETRRAAGAGAALVIGDWNDQIADGVFDAVNEPDARASFLTEDIERGGAFTYVPWERMLDHMLATDELLEAMPATDTRVLALDETWRSDYVDIISDHRPVITTLEAKIRWSDPTH